MPWKVRLMSLGSNGMLRSIPVELCHDFFCQSCLMWSFCSIIVLKQHAVRSQIRSRVVDKLRAYGGGKGFYSKAPKRLGLGLNHPTSVFLRVSSSNTCHFHLFEDARIPSMKTSAVSCHIIHGNYASCFRWSQL